MKYQISALSEEVTVMKLDIEGGNNRSLRKTLIFKSIPLLKKGETWEESNNIIIKEIKSVMPTVEEAVNRDIMERVPRSLENEFRKNWQSLQNLMTDLSRKSIKTSFIRAKLQIYVLQMYSPAITKGDDEVIKVRKDLKRNEPTSIDDKKRKGQVVQLIY